MKTKINVQEFIKESGADAIVNELKQKLVKDGRMPVFSDLIKKENKTVYQYVNYVQEGGGVLGVALVGYTYILEKLGIRFLRLAGTSAGAINTIMLASVDKRNYTSADEKLELKSEIILYEMLNYDFWKFVDGNWFTKLLIRLFINSKIGTKILEGIVVCSIVIPLLYALFSIIIKYVFPAEVFSTNVVQTSEALGFLTSLSLVILLVVILLVTGFFTLFRENNFGINPGIQFHNWIKEILERNHISTAADLDKAMADNFVGLELRTERAPSNDQGDTTKIEPPYITIITSDITNKTKVEFPLMAKDYWKQPSMVSP
ncbi:MAG: patatin-like phospholipase family protein, partial [Ilyomonas sp.]